MLNPSQESIQAVAKAIGNLFGAAVMIKLERDFGTIDPNGHWENAVIKTDAIMKEAFGENKKIGWEELRKLLRLACKRTLADLGE